MTNTMAEVLAAHQLCAAWENDESRSIFCMCGLELPAAKDDVGIDLTFLAAHQAAMLAAAGFGPVKEAQDDAWELGVIHGHNAEGRLIDKREANPYRV